MTSQLSVSALVSSLQANNSLVDVYSKHFNEALEKAKANGGVVVISNSASNNPRIIAVENHAPISDYLDDGNTDSNSRDVAFEQQQQQLQMPLKPKRKRLKSDSPSDLPESSLKEIMKNIHKAIVGRLDNMEKKMDSVTLHCQCLEEKVESMAGQLRDGGVKMQDTLLEVSNKFNLGSCFSSNIKLITLNTECEYPDGSWLGDENNPEFRVRCHISPSDLINLNRNCHTPEKMALTLLDYLFDRETQACSNISGHGKHGKKQLDPLMIYGIKCHLTQKFQINEKDWQRIKLNLDSKCRTAFRRKLKGMPLTVKAFREKNAQNHLPTNGELEENNSSSTNDGQRCAADAMTVQLHAATEDDHIPGYTLNNINLLHRRANPVTDGPMVIKGESNDIDIIDLDDKEALVDLMENHAVGMELGLDVESIAVGIDQQSQIIHTLQGDIQVVHATPEQLAEIHRTGKIQILSGNHFFQEVSDVLNLSTHSSADINLASMPNGLCLDDGHDAMAELKLPTLSADDEKSGGL